MLLKTTITKIAPTLINLWQENYESTGRLYLKNKIKQPQKARNLKASLKSKTVLVLGAVLDSLPEAAGSCSSFHPELQSGAVSTVVLWKAIIPANNTVDRILPARRKLPLVSGRIFHIFD